MTVLKAKEVATVLDGVMLHELGQRRERACVDACAGVVVLRADELLGGFHEGLCAVAASQTGL